MSKQSAMWRHKSEGISISFFRGFHSHCSSHLPHFYDITWLIIETLFKDRMGVLCSLGTFRERTLHVILLICWWPKAAQMNNVFLKNRRSKLKLVEKLHSYKLNTWSTKNFDTIVSRKCTNMILLIFHIFIIS